MRYTAAGTYVAICNNTNFDGHYTKVFEYPQTWIDKWNANPIKMPLPDAGWYFMNKVNFEACIEAVYPIEIFFLPERIKV